MWDTTARLIAPDRAAEAAFSFLPRHDAEELVACLRRLAAIIDPVVSAIGSYANHHFGWVDQRLFKDQLLNALEGDATFVIQEAADNFILEQRGLR